MTRQLDQMAGRIGIALAAPYYDDRVIEAGLAVRPEDRVTPWRYKPLIVEAMRGIVPDGSLTRQTKANGSGDVEPGLRRHRAELLALWEDSRLGALGLIDAAALREACTRPLPPELQFGVLDQLVACEVWLRSLEPVTVPALRNRHDAEAARRGVHRRHRLRHRRCWTRTAASTSTSTRPRALVLRTLLAGGSADAGGAGAHRRVRGGRARRPTGTSPTCSAELRSAGLVSATR